MAIAALRWWRDAGVSDALTDAPVAWTALPDQNRASADAVVPENPIAPDVASDAAAPDLRAFFPPDCGTAGPDLSGIADLPALRRAAESHEGWAPELTAQKLVFGAGNPQAQVLLLGEAPDADEARTGQPFAGPPGVLLDRMLAAIGLDRSAVYSMNIVMWRPPGGRPPTAAEVFSCLGFTLRQIALVNPAVIVALGPLPFQALVNTNEGIVRARGQWRTVTIGSAGYSLLPTLSPAYLLKQPGQKASSWQDLQALKLRLV